MSRKNFKADRHTRKRLAGGQGQSAKRCEMGRLMAEYVGIQELTAENLNLLIERMRYLTERKQTEKSCRLSVFVTASAVT